MHSTKCKQLTEKKYTYITFQTQWTLVDIFTVKYQLPLEDHTAPTAWQSLYSQAENNAVYTGHNNSSERIRGCTHWVLRCQQTVVATYDRLHVCRWGKRLSPSVDASCWLPEWQRSSAFTPLINTLIHYSLSVNKQDKQATAMSILLSHDSMSQVKFR